MLKGKSILVAMFLLALFAVSAVSAADNATEDIADVGQTLSDEIISVGQTQATGQANDDETIGETDDGTFTALQQKINDAGINATITLSNNYTYNNGFSTKGISINKDLTIDGQGHTINGDHKARIFNVENGHNVVFRNITFIGANAFGVGGAMSGGSAVNCTFISNYAGNDGGAMSGGSAVNCTFISNSAGSDGGAIWGGSAVNCTFISNYAGIGGGAMEDGSAVNCDLINNTARSATSGAISGGSADTCVCKDNSPNDYAYYVTIYGPSLSVENYTSFYNSGDKLLFNLSTHSGMRVTNRNITIDIFTSDRYYVDTYYSLSDGWVVPLVPGKYIASCKATDFDMQPVTATLTIEPVNLTADYTVSALDDGFSVNITVSTDPAINDNLTVRFNGKEYSVEAINGTTSFTSDKVYSNDYNTEILYPGSGYYNINVAVKPTNVTQLNNFTYYYYNDDMGSDSEKGISKVQVVDADGNPIKNGVVTITFGDMYKLKVKTGSDGVAEFTKAYMPGTYSVSVQYDNKTTKLGNLVLKSVVSLPKLSKVSKSAKATTIKITLKGTGPIKGKTVIVTFMKKQYTIKTDKNGVAQFKVTQSMVSKLITGKTYKIRATYRMDSVAQGIQILK